MGETHSKSQPTHTQRSKPAKKGSAAVSSAARRKRTVTVPIDGDARREGSAADSPGIHHSSTLIAPAIADEYPSISSITPRPHPLIIGRHPWEMDGTPHRPTMTKKTRSLDIPPTVGHKKKKRAAAIRQRLGALRLPGSHDLASEVFVDHHSRTAGMNSPLPETFGKLSDSCLTSGAESAETATSTASEEDDHFDEGYGSDGGYGLIEAPQPRAYALKKKSKTRRKPPLLPKLSESKSEHSYVRRRSRASLRRSGSVGKHDASSALTRLRRRRFGAAVADKLISIASPPIESSQDESSGSDGESAVSACSKQSASQLARSLSLTPKTEKRISSSIEEMYSFWMECVRPLMEAEHACINAEEKGRRKREGLGMKKEHHHQHYDDDDQQYQQNQIEYQRLCLLIYTNMFKRLPSARKLFLSRDISVTAKQVMGMLGWLVLCLGKQDAMKLIPRLKELGMIHQTRGVKSEYYQVMLDAIHESFTEVFEDYYTLRVRFSLSQLFTVASDVMCERDFTSKASALRDSKKSVMKYITSLDDCLSHSEGKVLLEKYMQQHFCHELWLFIKEVRRYQALNGESDELLRRHLGQRIMEEFIEDGSPMQVNLSHGCRILMHDLSTRIRFNHHCSGSATGSSSSASSLSSSSEMTGSMTSPTAVRVYPVRLFDTALSEAKLLIKSSVWTNFQATIVQLAGVQKEFGDWQSEQIAMHRAREKKSRLKKSKSSEYSGRRLTHGCSVSIDVSAESAPKSMKDLLAQLSRASDDH